MRRSRHQYRRFCLCALYALLTCLCLLGVLNQPTQAAPTDEPPARIRVVSDNNYPPYLFLDANGKPQGYEVDMWRLFEKYTGTQIELIPTTWANAQKTLLEGNADVIDMIFLTPKREKLYDFSAPFTTVQISIYADRNLPAIRDTHALRDLPVGVEAGDACVEKLESQGITRQKTYPGYQQIIDATLHGEVRIFCMDEGPATYYLYRNEALDKFPRAFPLYKDQFRRAVRKGDTRMLAMIEHGMAQIPPEEIALVKARWLERPFVFAPWMRMTGIALGIGLGIVLILTLWLWVLKRSVQSKTAELIEEQNKLRGLLNASPDAMWLKDKNGIYLEGNARVFEILHLRQRPLTGLSDNDLFSADAAVHARQQDIEVMQSGKQTTFTFPVDSPTGVRQLETIKVPLYAPGGALIGVLGAARDVTERLQNEAQLRLWAHAFQHAAFGMVLFNVRTHCIAMVNPTFAEERGYTCQEMVGLSVDALYPADIREERAKARTQIDQAPHTLIETEHITRDGRRFPVQLDISISRDIYGAPQFAIALAQDISARIQAERELRLAAVAFQTQEAMLVLDTQGHIQRINAAFTTLTGFADTETVGKKPSMLEPQGPEYSFYRRVWEQVQDAGAWQGEFWISDKRRQLKLIRAEITPVADDSGRVAHYVCAMTDLTGEHEAHARAEHMARFDPLTDLPNRSFLIEKLQGTLSDPQVSAGALLLFDVDNFKRINDLRGHAIGDRLLAYIAQRLHGLLGEEDTLSRFSGGTFALLLSCKLEAPSPVREHAPAIAERIRRMLREPFWLGNTASATVSVSIGWTELRYGHATAEIALKEAELAMYTAKKDGRDCIRAFEPAMLAALERKETLADDLLDAVTHDDGGLELYLQPQINLQGQTIGAEALLRFTRPNGERVPPDAFIPLAEDNGLILPIGDWVLQRACERLAAWAKQPLTRDLVLAINVSAKQFTQPSFVEDVHQALLRSGAHPQLLKLEITESMILGDVAEVASRLTQLRALGISISLDDFGTGYSSLAYLSRLPLDQLKIDKSFVMRLPADSNDATVAQTIIATGHGLGLDVIAEGVETQAQRDFLIAHGCHAFQGYLFSRPQPLLEFEAWLQESSFEK